VGHVTWDRRDGGQVLGGSASYAALTARKLGWDVGVLTSAGPDFEPERDLPGFATFVSPSPATTRFVNEYDPDGTRHQIMTSRAEPLDLAVLPDEWRDPDVLFLAPVAGEVPGRAALSFSAEVVGAGAQGWLRACDAQGKVAPCAWADPEADLAGVHLLFLSQHDLPDARGAVPGLLRFVPMVAVTRGWEGLTLFTRETAQDVAALPRPEVDPTGAGDVFAAACLLRYQETGDPLEAAAFGACAASCVVEGVGASTLGDRAEIERRLELRQRLVEDGEWEE
jgi:sugar/nucleoside kinase (ribokinase family)